MTDKYFTVRQFLTNRWRERYVVPNKLNKPNLSEKEKQLLESMKGLLPSKAKVLIISKKAKRICEAKNLPFHKVSKGRFSKSSVFVFPELALREAVGD